jgi:hypothetical protein
MYPVLWTRNEGRLQYTLCAQCAIDANKNERGVSIEDSLRLCDHKDEERKLTGYWPTREIDAALKRGYILTKVNEVHHWGPTKQSTTLFRKFILTIYRLKMYAEGYKTEADRDKLIADTLAVYPDMELKAEDFMKERNHALRLAAKGILNKGYGKTLQQRIHADLKFVHDTSEHREFVARAGVEKDIELLETFFKCDLLKASSKVEMDEDSSYAVNKMTNEWVGGYVTCYARLRLLDVLEKCGDAADGTGPRAVYWDTDGCIVYTGKEDRPIPTSDILGGLKLEVARIDDYVAVGSKFYGYRHEGVQEQVYNEVTKKFELRPKITIKAKGFPQTYRTSETMQLERLKQMAAGNGDQIEISYLSMQEKRLKMYASTETRTMSQCFTQAQLVRIPHKDPETGDTFVDIVARPFGY